MGIEQSAQTGTIREARRPQPGETNLFDRKNISGDHFNRIRHLARRKRSDPHQYTERRPAQPVNSDAPGTAATDVPPSITRKDLKLNPSPDISSYRPSIELAKGGALAFVKLCITAGVC